MFDKQMCASNDTRPTKRLQKVADTSHPFLELCSFCFNKQMSLNIETIRELDNGSSMRHCSGLYTGDHGGDI